MIEMPKLPVEGYVIYSPSKELFSTGGDNWKTKWAKRPKIWRTRGHVSNHLAMHIHTEYERPLKFEPYSNIHKYSVNEHSIYFRNDDAQIIEIGKREIVCSLKEEFARLIDNRIKKDYKEKMAYLKSQEKRLKKATEIVEGTYEEYDQSLNKILRS